MTSRSRRRTGPGSSRWSHGVGQRRGYAGGKPRQAEQRSPAAQAGGQRRAVGAVHHHESAAEPGLRSSREGTAGVGNPAAATSAWTTVSLPANTGSGEWDPIRCARIGVSRSRP
jgi:hypothetical protein